MFSRTNIVEKAASKNDIKIVACEIIIKQTDEVKSCSSRPGQQLFCMWNNQSI